MLFDYVYEKIVSNLQATSPTLPVDDRFTVYPDFFRNVLPASVGNHVFVYLGNQNPSKNQNSGARNYYQFENEYILDLLTISNSKYNRQTNIMNEADRLAGIRLRRLLFSVLDSTYHYLNNNFENDANPVVEFGEVAITNYPRVEAFFPTEPTPGEKAVVGLRVTIPVDLVFVPTGNPGVALEEILVSSGGQNPYSTEIEFTTP